MLGVGSSATDRKVFHKMDCMYAQRIKYDNRIEMNPIQAESRNYYTCKYCGGLKGELRLHREDITKWEEKYRMQFFFDERNGTLYIRTEIGFWKLFMKEDIKKCLLYHKNKFDSAMSMEDAMKGEYHRQKDMKATGSLKKLVEYIAAHDKAKQIIAVDYRMLPQTSKKQKRYYKAAEKKAKRQEEQRLDDLFLSLEKGNVEFMKLSIC